MSENISNNKRIAKNTILLYIRMLFLMLIGVYTSRVLLQALGIENYGIYNVVAGREFNKQVQNYEMFL